jgi:hypothetical protein
MEKARLVDCLAPFQLCLLSRVFLNYYLNDDGRYDVPGLPFFFSSTPGLTLTPFTSTIVGRIDLPSSPAHSRTWLTRSWVYRTETMFQVEAETFDRTAWSKCEKGFRSTYAGAEKNQWSRRISW